MALPHLLRCAGQIPSALQILAKEIQSKRRRNDFRGRLFELFSGLGLKVQIQVSKIGRTKVQFSTSPPVLYLSSTIATAIIPFRTPCVFWGLFLDVILSRFGSSGFWNRWSSWNAAPESVRGSVLAPTLKRFASKQRCTPLSHSLHVSTSPTQLTHSLTHTLSVCVDVCVCV
mgnify:CR=1 FL=1